MKTLADLKRDAKSGAFEARMLVRCGSDNIPEQLQGWRRIATSNTVSLFFVRPDGNLSELPIPKASLVEYDGQTLTTYYAGYRDLTADEQKVMDGWRAKADAPEFKERAEYDALSDGSSTYYEEVSYFRKYGMEYMMGSKKQCGKRYDWNAGKVQDDSIKGDVCMRYEIRKVAQ